MTLSQYKKVRIVTAMILGAVFSQAIIFNKIIIPVVVLAIASLFLFYLRKKVKGVIADERDYSVAGKSALLAIQLFSTTSTIIMLFFYYARKINAIYEPIAMVLAFSVCALMLVYSIIFRIKSGKGATNEK